MRLIPDESELLNIIIMKWNLVQLLVTTTSLIIPTETVLASQVDMIDESFQLD